MSYKYSYFTFLLNTDKIDGYVEGAITLAHSIKKYSNYDVNCIIEKGISKKYIDILKKHFNNVFEENVLLPKNKDMIEYMYYSIKKWKKEDMYNHWIERVLTKFKVLKYTQYDKILLLDTDMLAIRNLIENKPISDSIFEEYDTPAGTISTSISTKNNQVISESDIYRSLGRFGIRGGIMLFTPNKNDYKNFKKFINKEKILKWILEHKHKIIAGIDELLISLFYIKKWRKMDNSIMSIKWKDFKHGIFHHYNDIKPWDNLDSEFEDFKFWKSTYESLNL